MIVLSSDSEAPLPPPLLYHGTSEDFSVFAADPGRVANAAAFFTVDYSVAEQFAITAWESAGDADDVPRVLCCALVVTRPLVVDASEGMVGGLHNTAAMRALIKRARDGGFDSVYLRSVPEFPGLPEADQWAVFDPAQIQILHVDIVPGYANLSAMPR